MRTASAILVGVLGGVVALALGFGVVTAGLKAARCYAIGERWQIDTDWNPIDGCTTTILGIRVTL